ncbi:MAG TPA: hypothetical protein VLE99_04930 [Candidatus Saccharimonadales bacterium]|nr:hypothetical protein [Candidatus Saccharimonadales bacterium]
MSEADKTFWVPLQFGDVVERGYYDGVLHWTDELFVVIEPSVGSVEAAQVLSDSPRNGVFSDASQSVLTTIGTICDAIRCVAEARRWTPAEVADAMVRCVYDEPGPNDTAEKAHLAKLKQELTTSLAHRVTQQVVEYRYTTPSD